jgi:hypothetical protein
MGDASGAADLMQDVHLHDGIPEGGHGRERMLTEGTFPVENGGVDFAMVVSSLRGRMGGFCLALTVQRVHVRGLAYGSPPFA